MKQKQLYLVLAVIGLVVPYYFFVTFLRVHGLDGKAFVAELFGSPISTFFAVDLLLSCVVFVRFLGQETARHSMGHSWIYIVALCTVGLSFALPLFLYARESRLDTRT